MPDQLITIASYTNPFDAYLVRSELESFEVEVTLKDIDTISLNWMWSTALGGVKIQVYEPDVEEALRILAAEQADGPSHQTHAVGCPACGSNNTHFFLDKRGAFLTWLLLGFPLLPGIARQKCVACGKRFKASARDPRADIQ